MQLVARTGAPAPGIANENFSVLSDIRNAGAGQVAIDAYGRIPNTLTDNVKGFWVGSTSADLQPLFVTGQPAAGFPQGWSYVDNAGLVFNRAGTALLAADVQGPLQPPPQPPYPTDFAVYTGTRQDNLQKVFQLGSAQQSSELHVFGLTDSGRLVVTDGFLSLRVGAPDNLQQVQLNGQAVLLNDTPFAVSVAGERYVAAVTPFGRKVITGTNANDATVLASGDAMPGAPSGTTLNASLVHVDPSGRITLGAGVSGPNYFQGYWQGTSPADLHPIVMTGGPAPGTNDTLDFIHTAAVNDAGQLAFVGDLRLNGTADGAGMFAYDPAIGLQLMARTGDTVQVGPGDVRTISAFVHPDLVDTPALSDTGTLLFRVDFTDGSSGLMLADVPEPKALSVIILVALCSVRRRSRRHSA